MRFLCYKTCHLSSAHSECWKIDMLTEWCRSSVVSVSLQRRLSFSMKIQGTPGILRKNISASTSGKRHKTLFHWCYGERCPQCLQRDWGSDSVCTPDTSGHISMLAMNAKRCTGWFSCCPQGTHRLFGYLIDALEKVKKAPQCIVPWHDPHKQPKFMPVWRLPVVKGRACDRFTLVTITRGASVLRKEHIAAG